MHIVNTKSLSQTIYIAPRNTLSSGSEYILRITDEETNTQAADITSIEQSITGNYVTIPFEFSFTLNRYYSFVVLIEGDPQEEVYKGKMFCTNATELEKFSVNTGEFAYYEDTDNDNQYIYR